jgi:hypothetical protein
VPAAVLIVSTVKSVIARRAQLFLPNLLKLEEPPNEVMLTLSFGSQLEAPIARLLREQLHGSLNGRVKTSALDRYAWPDLFPFEIEKTAFKIDHRRPLVAKVTDIRFDGVAIGLDLSAIGLTAD